MAATLSFAAHAAWADRAEFDHTYAEYGTLLAAHVTGDRVDYAKLKANRASLDRIATAFGAVARADETAWSRAQRMAYWINAYNLFTLRAIVDHYPIRGSWLSLYPRNSIRQIDGVWTGLRWQASGRSITLDEIEHTLLRPEFQDPRVHFAVNCASIGCPPLATDPYRADRLDAQLDAAAVRFLQIPRGLVVENGTLRLSSMATTRSRGRAARRAFPFSNLERRQWTDGAPWRRGPLLRQQRVPGPLRHGPHERVFNAVNVTFPVGTLSSGAFGRFVSNATAPRIVQLSARVSF